MHMYICVLARPTANAGRGGRAARARAGEKSLVLSVHGMQEQNLASGGARKANIFSGARAEAALATRFLGEVREKNG